VHVEPSPGHLQVWSAGNNVVISAATEPHATYTVTLPAGLMDTFGQGLGDTVPVQFQTGGLPARFSGPSNDLMVLDPAAKPAFPVYTVNHKRMRVRVYQAGPEQYGAFSEWMRKARYDGDLQGEPPLKRLADEVVDVQGYEPDTMVETSIDLSPWLKDGKGQLVVWVEPKPQGAKRWDRVDLIHWVEATDIGLTAWVDHDQLLGWATRLSDGAPLEGVSLTLQGSNAGGPTASTGEDGTATMPLRKAADGPHVLVARQGDDVALLPESYGWWNQSGGWHLSPPQSALAWYTADDRQMYRPGETVSVKGWIRRVPSGPRGDVQMPAPMPATVGWAAYDAQNVEIGRGKAEVDATGGFDLALKLPGTPNLGHARIDFSAAGDPTGHSLDFQIQEFRRPEFEVTTSAPPGPYVLGDHATIDVKAAYYAGDPLPGAEVDWRATATAATFQPPGWEGWRFGEWVPWWRGLSDGLGGPSQVEHLQGRTDATGTHRLGIDFTAVEPPRPYTVSAEATVLDVNRQRWTSKAQVLVHPASVYVGLKPNKPFIRQAESLDVQGVVVGIDGKAVPGADFDVILARLEWKKVGTDWKEVEADPVSCSRTSAAEAVKCTFNPTDGGAYRLTAMVHDAEGRPNRTRVRVWVSGPASHPSRGLQMEELTLVPDQESYQPGETAHVLVQAPLSPAEGVWTLQRDGLAAEHRFSLKDGSTTLDIPIDDTMLPQVHLQVDVAGSAERTDDLGHPLPDAAHRPAQATGSLDLKVPPAVRALSVEVKPEQDALSPGGSTVLDLHVTDAQGEAVQGEVAVVAVDEAVLSLTGYRIPDPLDLFYQARSPGVSTVYLRNRLELARAGLLTGPSGSNRGAGGMEDGVMLEKKGALRTSGAEPPPPPTTMPMAARARAAPAPAAQPEPIAVRENFAATALFAPSVHTSTDGTAKVTLKLPDSLTRYRIMAVAVSGAKQFGTGEATVTARLPLMLRPSPPRFLNFGDRVEMPLVVQNQTGEPQTVQIALQAINARMIPDVATAPTGAPVRIAGRQTSVPAHDRVEVRIPVAAYMAGKARFQAVIASGDYSDAARFDLPVWTPATSEAFATYGEIDGSKAIVQPVKPPKDVWTQFGGLEVSTSSTTLQALTDAVLYLTQYPYECNEQLASRILAVASLRDVLAAFHAEQLPSPEELNAAVTRDLGRLQSRQNGNGGFGFWGPDGQDWPFLTVHVTNALVQADKSGYDVPAPMKARALDYLAHIRRHIPGWYSPEARWAITAYALSVREQAGDPDPADASKLIAEAGGVDELPLEALGWSLPTLDGAHQDDQVAAILKRLGNSVAETAQAAHWVTHVRDGQYVLLDSDRRVDGVLLDALIRVRPDSDLVPKVVKGLLAHRTRGRWGNTQENAFVLLAMHRYFETYEAQTPDFVARAWLGQGYLGDHAFQGHTTETATTDVPMSVLSDPGGQQDLVIQKDGAPGRLYYRVGMRYAPRNLTYEPADYGFTVLRSYEAIDDPKDVTRDGDGTWHIKAGARVRVALTMVAPARRYHVMLVDPIPAGLEAQNPALATTGTLPPDPQATQSRWAWWMQPWYQHQNLRDERVEAYTSLLWDGVWRYSYVAAATTPGEFVVPPAKAQEMYAPETFGRSGSDRVIVE